MATYWQRGPDVRMYVCCFVYLIEERKRKNFGRCEKGRGFMFIFYLTKKELTCVMIAQPYLHVTEIENALI